MLIRPFDHDDDRLAIIEKRGWHFDCVVAQQGILDEGVDYNICTVDVPVTEGDNKTAIVLINEDWLLELTQRVMRMNILLAKDMGQPVEEIMGSQPSIHAVIAYKRTAVSLALEDLLDEIDIWLDDREPTD